MIWRTRPPVWRTRSSPNSPVRQLSTYQPSALPTSPSVRKAESTSGLKTRRPGTSWRKRWRFSAECAGSHESFT